MEEAGVEEEEEEEEEEAAVKDWTLLIPWRGWGAACGGAGSDCGCGHRRDDQAKD